MAFVNGVFTPPVDIAGLGHWSQMNQDVASRYFGSIEDAINTTLAGSHVSPEQYGAVGDGVADDTAAVQSWISGIIAGGLVGMGRPGSIYKLTSTITATGDVIAKGNGAKILFDNPTLNGDFVLDFAGTRAANLARVEITGWVYECTNNFDVFVFAKATQRLVVSGNRGINGKLLLTWLPPDSTAITAPTSSRPTVGNVTATDRCTGVVVADNHVTGDDSAWSGAVHQGPTGDRADFRATLAVSARAGTFAAGELVTQASSGATAYVVFDLGDSLILRRTTPWSDGTPFTVGQGITGTSGSSATAGVSTAGGINALTGEGQCTAKIFLGWVDGATVRGNVVSDDRSGILWYGGDSNPNNDGGAGATRGVKNVSIVANVCRDFRLGGIWGSLGENIVAAANVCERGLDIGVHSEGGLRVVVQANAIRNFQFGGINPYFAERACAYIGNVITIDDAATYGTVLVKNNMGFDEADMEVLIANNVIRMDDPTATGRVEFQRGGTLKFEHNILWQTVISAQVTNGGEREIVNNRLSFPRDPGAPAIQIGQSLFAGSDRTPVNVVAGNRIVSWGWLGAGFQPAIYGVHAQASGSRTSHIAMRGNEIVGDDANTTPSGFPQDIVTESLNTVGPHATDIVGNGLWQGVVFDISDKFGVGASSLNQFVMLRDNYSTNPNNSTPFGTTPPTRGVYLLGSRIDIDRPTIGGPSAWIVAGTQKVWAPSGSAYSAGSDYAVGAQVNTGGRVYVAKRASGPATVVVTPGGGSTTYDPPSLADGATTTTTVTVTGARSGDPVTVRFTNAAPDGYTITGEVTADDTVTVTFANNSGGASDLASGTLTAYTDHWRDIAPTGTGTAFRAHGHTDLSGSATWNPGSIASGAAEAVNITVTGAALGDFVLAVSFSLDVTDLVLTAAVTAPNTVTAVLANNTGGAVDLAEGTIAALVRKA